jgi:hypothetical protein
MKVYPENTGMIFYWTTHIEQLTRISFQVFYLHPHLLPSREKEL